MGILISFIVVFFPAVERQQEPPASVVVFLAVDCPISQKYIPELNRLFETFQREGVEMIGYVPGSVKGRVVKTFVREYAIRFPLKIDRHYREVNAVQAQVTPEVFVFDRNRNLRYRGAIDNWFYDLGKYRHEADEHYLEESLVAVLAGREPKIRQTEAIGCPIQGMVAH